MGDGEHSLTLREIKKRSQTRPGAPCQTQTAAEMIRVRM
jgi:hypothetical protein